MLFVLTGILFWIIFSVAIVLLIISAATESSWWGAAVILGFFGALWVTGYKENVLGTWDFIVNNPVTILIYFLGYLGLGVIYSFFKWYLFLLDKREEYLAKRAVYPYTEPPQISDYKEKLFNWIFYWPIGLVWNLIQRPFRRIFNFLYKKISGGYQKMSDRMFKDARKEK